jgi:iron complex transport system permease protein
MKPAALGPGLAGLLLLAVLGGVLIGATPLPALRALAALAGAGPAGDMVVVWEIRLPRALAAALVGAALGMSGAALQGLLRNPLAEPGVLGVSAAASLAAAFSIYYGFADLGPFVTPAASAAGALAATALLALAALRTSSVVTLILIGVGLSSLSGALLMLLMNLAPQPFTLSDMVNWSLGSVANRSLEDIAFAAPFLVAGAALLAFSARGLSVLTLGEEAAAGAGLDLSRMRLAIVAGAGLAVGGAVSLAGGVGFVGLVAGHVVRPLVGHDPARTLWPAALLGAVLVVAADILVRIIPTLHELKIGVVLALIGAPFFVWIALERRTLHG